MTAEKRIVIISGEKNQGKSTFIKHIIDGFSAAGFSICGLYSPGIYVHEQKTGITVTDLTNGSRMQLADHEPGWDPDMPAREWRFNQDAIEWGDQVLGQCIKKARDVLIVDEIGYLELEKGMGWKSIFPVLEKNNYIKAYLVVRNDLLGRALEIWQTAQIISINNIESIESWLSKEVWEIMTLKDMRTNQFQKPQ
jgi:nucleoside-triphosphatase